MDHSFGKRKRWNRQGAEDEGCGSSNDGRPPSGVPSVGDSPRHRHSTHQPQRKIVHFTGSSSPSSTTNSESTISSTGSSTGSKARAASGPAFGNNNSVKVSSSSEQDSTCTNVRNATAARRLPSTFSSYHAYNNEDQDGGSSYCPSPRSSLDSSGDEEEESTSSGSISSRIYEDSSSGDESSQYGGNSNRHGASSEAGRTAGSGWFGGEPTTGPTKMVTSPYAPILQLGSDAMAAIVSFLDPPETLRVLTAPLCKRWRQSYTGHQDLWRTLCCTDPFAAKLASSLTASCPGGGQQQDRDGERKASSLGGQNCSSSGEDYNADYDQDDDDDSFCSLTGLSDRKLPARQDSAMDFLGVDDTTVGGCDDDDAVNDEDVLGEYRLLYTSFVRCLNYLKRIQEDTKNGRPPSAMAYGAANKSNPFPTFGVTKGLQQFLASRRNALSPKDASARGSTPNGLGVASQTEYILSAPIGVLAGMSRGLQASSTDPGSSSTSNSIPPTASPKKPKFGVSMITARLLGPTSTGAPSHLNLPTNCAMYSIVNWMVAHPNVEGIQTMCMSTLPALLEDEQQRLTGQRVGLVELVLCAMLRFPESAKLHIAAFHSMVLLARPLGGREGMLFNNTMAETTRRLALTPSIRIASSGSEATNGQQRVVTSPTSSQPDGMIKGDTRGEMSGISVLIESMRRFESDEKLQATACWAMVNLALVPSQKTLLLSLGGIQAATSAMTKHPKCFDVQFRALFALINLVVPSKRPVLLPSTATGGASLTEKDVLDKWAPHIARLVVLAMENFCSSETILNRACLVLHNLSQSTDYTVTLLWTPHAYQMLEWCMTNHSTDPVLRKSASSTLNRMQAYLSQHPAEQRRFLQGEQRALATRQSTA